MELVFVTTLSEYLELKNDGKAAFASCVGVVVMASAAVAANVFSSDRRDCDCGDRDSNCDGDGDCDM